MNFMLFDRCASQLSLITLLVSVSAVVFFALIAIGFLYNLTLERETNEEFNYIVSVQHDFNLFLSQHLLFRPCPSCWVGWEGHSLSHPNPTDRMDHELVW